MNYKLSLIFSLLFLSNTLYQQGLNHSLNPFPEKLKYSVNTKNDTIYLLAVMVEFAEDKDASTYGNGKFGSHYSKNYGNEIIDPLPHNKTYFENQLVGLSNYYNQVSNGKVIIKSEVLDNIVQLEEVMSRYSPPPKSDDYSNIGKLFQSVWRKVDSLYKDKDFSRYSSFVIFHAGVGRDINITENFNLDKDIPSLYLNLNFLKKYLGDDFTGFPIGKNKTLVKNSMIIPETESREITSISGKVLIEIGIQGLLISGFGSFLGLPDLYNTVTGLSEIGRFGLMDGQAIFSYGGVIPPEPSAWEKIYLGWVKPIEVKSDTINLTLITRYADQLREGTILKVNINPYEYFLIENRQRDAMKNGAIIKYISDGVLQEKKFEKDTTGFYYYDIDSLKGIVVGIDEYDWALPGSGILIWHIDEKIIAEKFSENKINADHKNRGVYLKEADGIQDIGVKFRTIFGDEIVGDGEPNDLWFKENKSKLYKNEFSDNTLPNTKSNSGASSFITIKNFSNNGNIMTLDVTFGNKNFKPIFSKRVKDKIINGFVVKNNIEQDKLFFYENNTLYYYDRKSDKVNIVNNNLVFPPISSKDFLIILKKDSVLFYSYSGEQIKDKLFAKKDVNGFSAFTLYEDSKNSILICGTNSGLIYNFNYISNTYDSLIIDKNPVIAIAKNSNLTAYLTTVNLFFNNKKYSLSEKDPIKLVLAADTIEANAFVAVLYKNNKIETFDLSGNNYLFDALDFSGMELAELSVGDVLGDGNNYLIYSIGTQIFARNKIGALARNFPVSSPNKSNFMKANYLVDINNDKIPEVVTETKDGQLLFYEMKSGKFLDDFRLTIGDGNSGSSYFVNENNKLYYHTLSDSGIYQIFQISDQLAQIYWNGTYGNYYLNSSSVLNIRNNKPSEFLVKTNIYNWPNPVYDKITHIRYLVNEDSKIKIKIYDLSGAFVDELNGIALAGVEGDIKWDVTNIQNGVYLAYVEAISTSKSDYSIIKIAVVK